MKREKYCGQYCEECHAMHKHLINTEIICDTCGTQLSTGGHLIDEIEKDTIIELTINYVNYEFCNYQCLLKFITAELKKERNDGDEREEGSYFNLS